MMTGPGKERRDLIAAINAVWYREYARVAWLKAGVIGRLEADDEAGRWDLLSYTRAGDRSLTVCQRVIDLFSEGLFLYHTPESMGRPVEGADFVPTDAASALFFVEELARVSEGVDQPGVDYNRLTAYFFEDLFDAQRARFFLTMNPLHAVETAVAGMDDEVIGLFWMA